MAHILAAFAADPEAALTVADIAMRAYGVELRQVAKKHRVAVLRAMRRACELEPRLALMDGDGAQGQTIVHDRTCPLSYGLARLKGDTFPPYQWYWRAYRRWSKATEAEMRARLAEGGDRHDLTRPDGSWWETCRLAQAELEGDHETAARLWEKRERELAAFTAGLKAMCQAAGIGTRRRRPASAGNTVSSANAPSAEETASRAAPAEERAA